MSLPKSCEEGKFAQCWNCIYHAGALKHHCPKNGGDAEFEASGDKTPMIAKPPFRPYDASLTLSGEMLEGFPKDNQGRVMIRSRREERELLEKNNMHKVERGEKVMGVTAELKEVPAKKIYSFL